MKILYITPAFQHPEVRGPSRCYHFIRELSKRHEITLLTLIRSDIPSEAMDEMARYTEQIYTFDARRNSSHLEDKNLFNLLTLNQKLKKIKRLNRAIGEMKTAFLKLVKKNSYDLVLFHGKSVFPVIEDWKDLPIVIDFCDATSLRIRDRMRFENPGKRILLSYRYQQFRRIEKQIIQKTPHLAFISRRDRNAILGNQNGVKIVPIGVDLKFWKRTTYSPRRNTIVFTGVMNYSPNEDAALYLMNEIVPVVQRYIPELEVMIVGRDPSPSIIASAKKNSAITVTGFVEDVRTYLEQAAVFVAPVRYASGIQNKVLEAFAMEMPVVCTSAVSDGLNLEDDKKPALYYTDDPGIFASKIVKLLNDPDECNRLGKAGREFVEQNFIWSHNAALLEKLCLAAINERAIKHSMISSS